MRAFAFKTPATSLVALLASASFGCDSGKPPVSSPPEMSSPAGPTSSPTTPGAPTGATAPTETTAPDPTPPQPSSRAELRWAGAWSSPSCGDRKYERRITLKDDKTFTAEELVSPCPPKAQCFWSGIIFWQGRWELDDKGAVLTMTSGGQGGLAKIDSPLRLELDKSTLAPVEVRGAERCAYTRAPEGKTSPRPRPPGGPSPAPAPSL